MPKRRQLQQADPIAIVFLRRYDIDPDFSDFSFSLFAFRFSLSLSAFRFQIQIQIQISDLVISLMQFPFILSVTFTSTRIMDRPIPGGHGFRKHSTSLLSLGGYSSSDEHEDKKG